MGKTARLLLPRVTELGTRDLGGPRGALPSHTHLPPRMLLPLPGVAPVLSLSPPSRAPAHNLTLSTGEKLPNVHFTLLMLAFCFSFRSNHLLLTSCWVAGDFSVAGNLIPFLN